MTLTDGAKKALDEVRSIDVEPDYRELIEKFASLNLSDAYEIRHMVKSMVQLSNAASLQRILNLHEGPNFEDEFSDECAAHGVLQSTDIELLRDPILPFTHHWHHEHLAKHLQSFTRSEDSEYTKRVAIVLVNLAATPAMTQEFGTGFSLFKKSLNEQLRRRAKAMYNRFALDPMKIKGW